MISRPPGLGPESLRSRQAEAGPRYAAERWQRSIQFGETTRGGRLLSPDTEAARAEGRKAAKAAEGAGRRQRHW